MANWVSEKPVKQTKQELWVSETGTISNCSPKLTNEIGFDTLSTDMSTLGKTVEGIYKGWQSKKTMDSTKPQVESMYNRLKAFQSYNAQFGDGSVDVSEQINAYKSVLDDWDEIAKGYGKYKNADEYNQAVKSQINYDTYNFEAEKENTRLLESDLTAVKNVKRQISNLENDIRVLKFSGSRGSTKNAAQQIKEKEKKIALLNSSLEKTWSKYGNEDKLKALIAERKSVYKSAERYQSLQKLLDVVNPESQNYDKNFNKYVESGKKIAEDEYNGLNVYYGDYRDAYNALARRQKGESLSRLNGGIYDKSFEDNEWDLLAYYIGKDKATGKNQAREFLDLMEETLNQRESNEIYEKYLKDNTFLEVLYGVPVGLDQFSSGIKNLLNTKDDYIPASSVQMAGQYVREDLTDDGFKLPDWLGGASIAQIGYDTLSTTANMAPSILISLIPGVGQTAGAVVMGASAAGNAYQQALNNGMDKGQARVYSTLVGASEAVLSRTVSKVFGGKILSNKITTAIEGIEKSYLRFAANYTWAFVSEGAEEGLQEILTPLFENIALGYNKNGFEDIDWSEVAYSFLLGGLSGGNFELVGSGIKRISNVATVKQNYNTPQKVKNLLALGLSAPADSKVNSLAKKYNTEVANKGKLSANKLYNLAVASENFVSDRLSQLGEKNNISEVASAVVKKLTGVELSTTEIELLSKSDYGQDVLQTVVPKGEVIDTENSLQNGDDSAVVENTYNADLSEAEQRLVDTPDSELTPEQRAVKQNNTQADPNGPANFMPEGENEGEVGLSEPSVKEIHRDPTSQEENEAIFGKRKDAKQRHILDVAKKLDSNMTVVFVDPDSDKLSGQKGAYMHDTNTVYISADNSIGGMYCQIFKHEFVHRLESKQAYQGFKDYLFNQSSAFERYIRAELKRINGADFDGTREEAIKALSDHYIDLVKKSSFTEEYKRNFSSEYAEREMVANFVGKVLFKGKENIADVAQNLSDGEIDKIISLEDTFAEFENLNETERGWFQRIIDAIKDFIATLKGIKQNERLVNDLEYIEQRLARVLDSKDTKKAASRAVDRQYDINNDFYNQLNKWDKKTIGFSFVLGKTSEALKSAGIPEKQIRWDASKIKTLLNKHSGMTIEVINQIPELLENPVIVIDSKQDTNSRIIMGDLYDAHNKLVTVVLLLSPTSKSGNVLDLVKISSAEGRGHIQSLFKKEDGSPITIRYKDKKRIRNWLNVNRLQLPLHSSNTDSTDIILNEEDIVKNNISEEAQDYSQPNGEIKQSFALDNPTTEEIDSSEAETTATSDKPTERFIKTIIETGTLTDEMLEGMHEKLLLGDFSYEVMSDKAALEKAEKTIEYGTAENIWQEVINNNSRISKNQIAIGEKLLAKAIKEKDTKKVLALSSELADVFTRAGQVVQAARLLNKMTGAGRLISAQRTVETLNRDLRAKYGEDFRPIKISDAAAKRLAEAKTKEGIEHAYEEVMYDVAEQTPVTFLDKWNAWRYFAMLSNPKTHIRNIVGNAIFVPAVRIRYFLAASIESAKIKDSSQRTKSVIIKKEYRDFAERDSKRKEVKQLLKGNKYNDKSAIREKQQTFKSAALNFLTEFNSNALETEDILFKNKHYIHALAGYLQARGLDLKSVPAEVLDDARIYAVEEAKKATFNDESALANAIQRFANKNLATNLLVEGVLPFKRTPINIVKRGVEYSPLGLAKTLTKGIYDVKKGKITPTEYIDGLASGLTGTGIMLVGMFLANLGCVAGGEKEDDESQFEKLLGKQEYAIEFLGKSYTIDWAAPSCIPFFIGVEIVNTLNEGEAFTWSQLGNTVWNSLEPITNLSMISGIQGVIESAKYADSSQTLSAIITDALTSYSMQGIPSLAGAFSRTIDPTQRTWYTDKNSKWFDASSQAFINNVKSKIPGLSYTQIPKIDMWGRVVSRGGTAERVLENFVSPGYYSEMEYNDANEELKRIFNKTDVDVFPNTASKSFEVNGKTKHLTADEYVTYAKAKGEYSFDYINEFMEDSAYKNLSDQERADVIQGLYEYSNAKAKATVSDYDITKRYKTVTNWEQNGRSAVDYYIYKAITK